MNLSGTNNLSGSPLHLHNSGLRLLIASSCIVIYLFGYTGCLLSILTFSSRKLRRHSTGFLFLIMAFVDMLNLFASLQYFLDVIYHINVFALSIHWCRFFTVVSYELYFGFSWIFVFISLDRWIKVEWPTRSQRLCTREKYIYLCLITFTSSLIQNVIYSFLCLNSECAQKNLLCEVLIHVIYIGIYMIVPIGIILLAISRTCLITIKIKKRFRTANTPASPNDVSTGGSPTVHYNPGPVSTHLSNSFVSSMSSSAAASANGAASYAQLINAPNRLAHYRRRRTRLDTQMVILISINVAPFVLVHIVTELAYLFERYSSFVAQSKGARLIIIFIYLSWYLISATRFYTNCLLSRIYRQEFKSRLRMIRNGCKPAASLGNEHAATSKKHSSRYFIGQSTANGGGESIAMDFNQLQ